MTRAFLFRPWMAVVALALASVARAHSSPAQQSVQAALKPKHILHFSDVHLNLSASLDVTESEQIVIEYGDDAPISLLTSALTYAKQVLPSPELFLYTGDHAVHGELEDEYLAEVVETNVETLEKFYPAKDGKMLETTAIMGNADTTPDYTIDVTDGKQINPALSLIADAWSDSLSKSDLETFKRKGYLQYNLDDKLVVLTLNTVPYSPSHSPDTTDKPDPFGQFGWLQSTLKTLKKKGKFAYIMGHIPPMIDSYSGAKMWEESYISTYKQIVGKYAAVVKAQLFGHVHSIEFRVPLNEEQDSTAGFELVPLFTTAAISPIYDNNPAFMTWDYHPTTYELLDYAVYGTNISDGSANDLSWKLLFKASQAYGVKSLTTSELNGFLTRAASNATLLQQYYYNSKALSYLQSSCLSATCQAKWICTLKWWTTSADYAACVATAEASNTTTVVSMAASPSASTSTSSTTTSSPAGASFATISTVIGAVGVAAVAVLVVVRRYRKTKRAAATLASQDCIESPASFETIA